tara:strand:+ start:80058 stop:80408 length:351 start_codon:yes stop_codon:yes gene_type:complete
MPLRIYKCPHCDSIKKTLKDEVPKCHYDNECDMRCEGAEMEQVIKAPNGKFMVCANAATGKSKLKDSKKMLTERARNHNRETLLDDNIALNRDNKLGTAHNFLNEKGERRRKIDDI